VVTVKREIVSLIPAFELGVWNAWIFILPIIIIFYLILPKIFGKRGSGEDLGLIKKEKILSIIYLSIVFASYAYTIFLPLKLGTIWFYAGLLVYLLGMFIEILATLSFNTTPVEKPVTKGVYSISRNPQYVGDFFINISISIACLSWIFLLVAIVNLLLLRNFVVAEEHFLLDKYGNAYRDYMNRTPRWIGIPKSEKRD
jgi:protein-S-isoprenylcysteine O-methyltransferase Ste14